MLPTFKIPVWAVSIGVGLGIVLVAYTAGYVIGQRSERLKWRTADLETLAALNSAVTAAQIDAARLQSELTASESARRRILEELNNAAMESDGADAVCLGADGVRELEDALDALGTSRRTGVLTP